MTKPYTEEVFEKHGTDRHYIIRTFDDSLETEELVWHRDRKSRTVSVLQSNGWKLQIDDELPIELVQGKKYSIIGETFHRLLKGTGKLVVRIEEDYQPVKLDRQIL